MRKHYYLPEESDDELQDRLMGHNCGGPCPCEDCKLIKEELVYRAEERNWNRIHRLVKETLNQPNHSDNCMCRKCTGEYH